MIAETRLACVRCGGAPHGAEEACPAADSPYGRALAARGEVRVEPLAGLAKVVGGARRSDRWAAELRRLDVSELERVIQQCDEMQLLVGDELARRLA